MKSTLQPTSPQDLNALSEFLAHAFAAHPEAPFLNPALMAWKYWDRRDDWSGPRSYVLRREGAIVAHAGIWPMTFGEGEDRIRGVHMIDWASARESPGAGLALVQKFAAMFDFIFSIGGSEMTCKVLPAFGFVEHTRVWKGVRPLRPLRQVLTHQSRNWKLAPRLLRNWLWARQPSKSQPQDWTAIEVTPRKLAGEPGILPPQRVDARFSPRPPAFFEYILRCPGAPFRLYRIDGEGEIMGHFVISFLRGQARVAGIWLREDGDEGWVEAYRLAQKTAESWPGAYEVVVVGSQGLSGAAAAQAGFRMLPGPTVYLLDRTKRLRLPEDFQFQLCESDAALLDAGAASYWS